MVRVIAGEGPFAAGRVSGTRMFYLDDFGAIIGQQPGAEGG